MPLPALVLALALTADPAPCAAELFRIERSKNANVVLYEAKRGKDAPLDPHEPVTASWLLLATSGAREPLGFFERAFAYGFGVRAAGAGGFALTLTAFKDREVRVAPHGSCARATTTIAGRDAVLARLFVQADDSGPVPKVQWVDLHGTDAETGEALSERLVPGGKAR